MAGLLASLSISNIRSGSHHSLSVVALREGKSESKSANEVKSVHFAVWEDNDQFEAAFVLYFDCCLIFSLFS